MTAPAPRWLRRTVTSASRKVVNAPTTAEGPPVQGRTGMWKKMASAFCGVLIAGAAGLSQAATISGAGATFPAPVYAKWAEAGARADYRNEK